MSNSIKENWITSKEILVISNISRETLNNYIKMGILPRPVVGRSETGRKGSKQIGYFPEGTLERIQTVKRMKRAGEPMEQIARKFKETSPIKPGRSQNHPLWCSPERA